MGAVERGRRIEFQGGTRDYTTAPERRESDK